MSYMYIKENKDRLSTQKDILQMKKEYAYEDSKRRTEDFSRPTIQRIREVHLLKQNDGNCGLYCIRMAVNSLGTNELEDAHYNRAAERAGSKVGEIFSFATLHKIVDALDDGQGNKYTAVRRGFQNGVELIDRINETGGNPVLIPYSAGLLKEEGIATQLGHWSIIQRINGFRLTMANPWKEEFTTDIAKMYEANKELSHTGGKKPFFDWEQFIDDDLQPPYDMEQMNVNKPGEEYTKYILKNINGRITVSGGGHIGDIPVMARQPLDLSGYIVEIKRK